MCSAQQITESLHPGRVDGNGVDLSDTEDDRDEREGEDTDDETEATVPPRRPRVVAVAPAAWSRGSNVVTSPGQHGDRPLMFTNVLFLALSYHVMIE